MVATLENIGGTNVDSGMVLVAFFDADGDGTYDSEIDLPLGEAAIAGPLAAGSNLPVEIAVAGVLPFRDAPVSVSVYADVTGANLDNNTAAAACKVDIFEDPTDVTPVLKWHWDGSQTLSAPDSNQVMSTPMVGPLEDTNGDDLFNQDDVPSVVFLTFKGKNFRNDGVLRVVNGETGAELWSAVGYDLRSVSNPAIADIDNDGAMEVVVAHTDGGTVAFEHTGEWKWRNEYGSNPYGALAIADLVDDGNNTPEIVAYNYIFSGKDGGLIHRCSGYNGGPYGGIPIAADVNLDGRLEVVAGSSVCNPETGASLWKGDLDGYTAVADLFGDESRDCGGCQWRGIGLRTWFRCFR